MDWANDYIRVPFLDLGRTSQGADCWGLIKLIYQEQLSIELPSLLEYEDTMDRVTISDIVGREKNKWEAVSQGAEEEFDVGIFKTQNHPMHVGLVIKRGTMIHCEKGSGTSIINYHDNIRWNNRLVGFFRHAKRSNIDTSV